MRGDGSRNRSLTVAALLSRERFLVLQTVQIDFGGIENFQSRDGYGAVL